MVDHFLFLINCLTSDYSAFQNLFFYSFSKSIFGAIFSLIEFIPFIVCAYLSQLTIHLMNIGSTRVSWKKSGCWLCWLTFYKIWIFPLSKIFWTLSPLMFSVSNTLQQLSEFICKTFLRSLKKKSCLVIKNIF